MTKQLLVPKSVLYLSLGSNLGDRKANIEFAINRLVEVLHSDYKSITPIIETKALGFDGQDFLNCIVTFQTDLDPFLILRSCKGIEREMGRTDVPQYDAFGRRIYHDRVIDIDILMYGDLKIHTPELEIPHPQVESRAFIKELLLHL